MKVAEDNGKTSKEENVLLSVEEEIDLILRDEDYDLLQETSTPRRESTNKPSVLKKPEDAGRQNKI